MRKVRELAGVEIDSLLTIYIIRGTPISMEEFNEVLDKKLVLKTVKVFDLGFETKKTPGEKGSVITEVKPSGGAEEAGLLVGDRILGYNLISDPNAEGQLLIKKDEKETWVKFYPYALVSVPQFETE